MPFRSEKQRRYLWMKEPAIAKRWSHGEHSTKEGSKMPATSGGPLSKEVYQRRLKQMTQKAGHRPPSAPSKPSKPNAPVQRFPGMPGKNPATRKYLGRGGSPNPGKSLPERRK
jgi:hypothetical protein